MSRIPLPFHCEDISALARSLNAQLTHADSRPGHVELLNMLARGGGYRNFQHFRAQFAARAQLEQTPAVPDPEPPVDYVRIRRLVRFFDGERRMIRWPGKLGQQQTCLWVVWSRIPAGQTLSEPQINARLQDVHLFGDHALLRRRLCDDGLVTRTRDGREYRRVERRPPSDALALIRCLGQFGHTTPALGRMA